MEMLKTMLACFAAALLGGLVAVCGTGPAPAPQAHAQESLHTDPQVPHRGPQVCAITQTDYAQLGGETSKRTVNHYDSDGLLTKTEVFDPVNAPGRVASERLYHYDDQGRISRVEHFDLIDYPDAGVTREDTYDYDCGP